MRRFVVPVVIGVMVIAGALPAIAQVTEDRAAPELSYYFDDETGELTFAYGVGVDCSEGSESETSGLEPEGAGTMPADGDAASDGGPPSIEECTTIDATGPNGQINHGSAVSAAVHALKAYDLDVPRGHIVREFAKSDIGKTDKDIKNDDDDSSDDSDKPKKDKADKGKSSDKASKGKAKGKNK